MKTKTIKTFLQNEHQVHKLSKATSTPDFNYDMPLSTHPQIHTKICHHCLIEVMRLRTQWSITQKLTEQNHQLI